MERLGWIALLHVLHGKNFALAKSGNEAISQSIWRKRFEKTKTIVIFVLVAKIHGTSHELSGPHQRWGCYAAQNALRAGYTPELA